MLLTPHRRRIRKASDAPAESCLRFIQRKMASLKDWIPMLIRLTPSSTRPRTYSSPFSTMSSGFISIVNSSHCLPNIELPEGAAPPNPPRFALRPVSPAASHPFMWPRAATGSAGAPLPCSESIELTILERISSGSTEGVPPPMYKVLIARVLTISSRRSPISPHTASAYASKHETFNREAPSSQEATFPTADHLPG